MITKQETFFKFMYTEKYDFVIHISESFDFYQILSKLLP